MKKSHTLLISISAFVILAVTALLIIYGIKGDLQAFFTGKWGITILIAVVLYLFVVIFVIILDKVKKL